MRGSREGKGSPPEKPYWSPENYKTTNLATVSMLGYHWPASETVFGCRFAGVSMMTCFKWVFTFPLPSSTKKNAILAHLIDCYDPGRTVSREPTIHSGSLNTAEQSLSISSTVK